MALSSKELSEELNAIVKDCSQIGDTCLVIHSPKDINAQAAVLFAGRPSVLGVAIARMVNASIHSQNKDEMNIAFDILEEIVNLAKEEREVAMLLSAMFIQAMHKDVEEDGCDNNSNRRCDA